MQISSRATRSVVGWSFLVGIVACAGGGSHLAMAPAAAREVAEPGPMQVAKDEPEGTWRRSQIAPNATRLKVGDREELPLRGMQAKVTIDGFRARVVIDYLFENNLGRQLEGTFQLRLPEEASPYFFAFGENTYAAPEPTAQPMVIASSETEPARIMSDRASAWAHPREARMVPREKAAVAYGATVRRRVDPALVEWAGAGVFDARVFPLAPGKLHRIVVG